MIVLAHPLARDEGLLLLRLGELTGLGERG
jgi:hypothetical protein